MPDPVVGATIIGLDPRPLAQREQEVLNALLAARCLAHRLISLYGRR
jgi:hypothetical protein